METIREIQGNPGDVWDELSWVDMNSAEQALWAVFGWDEASWEEETDPPAASEKYWEEFTAEELDAAQKLGYTQSIWDEE
jgi:hypothetical protein